MNEPELRFVETNGIRLRVASMGVGPLVLLLHGFPESWYSWRYQLSALAKAGYRAVAPDMRGYGESDRPGKVTDYEIDKLTADVVGLVDALDEEHAILVGHDWGAIVGWAAVLQYPKKFRAYIAISAPCVGLQREPLLKSLRTTYGDNFYDVLYFQEEGIAESEFDRDPRGFLRRAYVSPGTPLEPPTVTDPKASAGGWLVRNGDPKERPAWLRANDLDYFVDQFTKSGFRGPINYYRNFDHLFEVSQRLTEKVAQPAMFIAGDEDSVIGGASAEQLEQLMAGRAKDLRDVVLIPKVGHWVAQSAPKETNAAILRFLNEVNK